MKMINHPHALSPMARLLPMPSVAFQLEGIKRTLQQYGVRISELAAMGSNHDALRELGMITDQIERLRADLRRIESANDA
jgi:hypothetical protein